uniref:TLDc domain-containing protein n=1 Tax=Corethrella appendiculata TaxID=1370023 RepID=U5EQF1_9DIPT
MIRSPSGADFQDISHTQFQPVEKLGKILSRKCEEKYGIHNGITADIFAQTVFPEFNELGENLFRYLHYSSKAKTKHLGLTAFRQQCERFLALLDDGIILEMYVKMFGDLNETELIKPDNFKNLLMTCYRLAMAHYSDGPQTCILIDRTLNSVVQSCFFSKESLSSGYICRWLENNCARLVPPIHKFCVHTLSTSYRTIKDKSMDVTNNPINSPYNLELQTPILEKQSIQFKANEGNSSKTSNGINLPLSEAWLLAGALPPLYSKPQQIQNPSGNSSSSNSSANLASQVFMAKLLSVLPSHWTLIYNSRYDGVGANRFLHHVIGYRGPNLILLRCDSDLLFCIGSPNEWRETHLYIGTEDSCCIQLLPKFLMLENKPKMLYLNTSIRGYPKGLRAGSDPRKPILIIDESFDQLEYRSIKYAILSIEVWGCGDKQSREVQLDIKKWEVKEAERQRTVKLTAADWMDHPDRYLLELGGRPQYNNSTQ